MSNDDFEHQMDFILRQQAVFSSDIEQLKEVQKQQAANLDKLVEVVSQMREEMDANRVDLRDAIDNLIIANEGSRHLAEEATRLAIAVSQRVLNIDGRVTELEQK